MRNWAAFLVILSSLLTTPLMAFVRCVDLGKTYSEELKAAPQDPRIQILNQQKAVAMTEYDVFMGKLQRSDDRNEMEKLIDAADQAQVNFVKAHNALVDISGGYKLLPLQKEYIGENFGKGFYVWKRGEQRPLLAGQGVPYLGSFELQRAKVEIRDGLFYDQAGKLIENADEAAVMTANGDIYFMPANGRAFDLRHSSLANGLPVAAAVDIHFDVGGKILSITNRSGHYKTPEEFFNQLVRRAKAAGVDLKDADINPAY